MKCSECGFDPKEYRHKYGCSRPDESTIEKLQARVKELKAERDAWKSAAQEAGLRTYDGLAQENARLVERVKELEKENELLSQDRQNWKTLASRDFPTELKEVNRKLAQENARLRKVVDTARVWRAATDKRDEGWADRCFEKWNDLDRALIELDGEKKCDCHNRERQVCDICQDVGGKYKCRHLISDQVGITHFCRSCGEMC